jgi:hypothetical protein
MGMTGSADGGHAGAVTDLSGATRLRKRKSDGNRGGSGRPRRRTRGRHGNCRVSPCWRERPSAQDDARRVGRLQGRLGVRLPVREPRRAAGDLGGTGSTSVGSAHTPGRPGHRIRPGAFPCEYRLPYTIAC